MHQDSSYALSRYVPSSTPAREKRVPGIPVARLGTTKG
jgi:hypothetical protein